MRLNIPRTVDFTLDELKTLGAKQRYPFRDQQYNGNMFSLFIHFEIYFLAMNSRRKFWYLSGKFPIITFDEYISIALDAPRVVGIYPEIKNPVFINQKVSKP